MREAGRLQALHCVHVKAKFRLLVDRPDLAALALLPKPRSFFVGQAVGRHVHRAKRQQSLDVVAPLIQRLPRYAEDQIARKIGDARPNDVEHARHVGRAVIAFEDFQKPRLKRLHAEAQAIDAECP